MIVNHAGVEIKTATGFHEIEIFPGRKGVFHCRPVGEEVELEAHDGRTILISVKSWYRMPHEFIYASNHAEARRLARRRTFTEDRRFF